MTRLKPALLLLLAAIVASALWHRYKPLPEGLALRSTAFPAHHLALLVDDTWETAAGTRGIRQEIFDEVFRLIDQAERQVVVDMFLFNDFLGAGSEAYRPLTEQLTRALIAKRHEQPPVPVVLITDPINTLYGGVHSPHLEQLREAGVTVVTTPLGALRDSNPGWSGFWRLCCEWAGNSTQGGWLPNPMAPGKVTLRSYLTLLNFKANHRKTLIVDEGEKWTALVTSANPHDGSSAHSNIALRFSGPAAAALLESELAVLDMAGVERPTLPAMTGSQESADDASLEVLTEAAIRDALLETVARSEAGDRLDVSVFYLSHRSLIAALKRAHGRGVSVRVLLDPNKDAFGRQKNGIPNRQVGAAFHQHGMAVRWCNTRGEQCHTKMLMLTRGEQAELILGSANFTRRNLDNLNLETSVRLTASSSHPIMLDASNAFLRRWENRDEEKHSLDYAAYADDAIWKKGVYRIMEFTGWSSF
ncbi:phospholipase D family protein [Alcanivorax sp. DP30]|uniref:phospholipase D family protein n=1 Tax=Alcanivorax sp. DP30 TaxID=2606217 RepID=UPI00136DD478|nr:phospholipase D family protein [Alcanivorax sp. DP30]MZR62403.1 phospholipase [Alcanivorax sp. DP30]